MDENATVASRSTDGMVDYDQHSSAQQRLVTTAADRIRDMVERIGQTETPLRVVDYGCGPGPSAIEAVRPAVESSLALQPDRPVVVCHADQPGNDWNGLFDLVWGPQGYRADGDGDRVRTEAGVGSFYDQMADHGSVDLATCFAASHWLDHAVRLHAPGTLWFADLTGSARRRMAEQARRDWTRFLSVRARELRSGGFLFVSTLAAVPDPTEVNGAAVSGRGIYRALQVVAQGMADDGSIDAATLDDFVFALWFPTADEARRPLVDGDLAAAFDVETVTVAATPENPTDFFADLVTDPVAYGDAYAGYIRAWADSTLRTQLIAPSATGPAQEEALANELFRRVAELYRTHLDEYAFELWHLTLVLRRR